MATLFGKKCRNGGTKATTVHEEEAVGLNMTTTPTTITTNNRDGDDEHQTLSSPPPSKRQRPQEDEVQSVERVSVATSSSAVAAAAAADLSPWTKFEELGGLAEPLVETCRSLGFVRPTPVQRTIIPFLLQEQNAHVLALAATGSGKTAAFVLPILHRLAADPYGVFAVILSPTRELAKQIYQQVVALGSAYEVQSCLVIGGVDAVKQSCQLDRKPHIVVATPGRLAELLRGPNPPQLDHVRYLVLDEADRLLTAENSGFERDVAELVLHCTRNQKKTTCQTLLFSATMTKSLESLEQIAGTGRQGRMPLKKFIIRSDQEKLSLSSSMRNLNSPTNSEVEDGTSAAAEGSPDDEEEQQYEDTRPVLPAGLKQEYVFMPSRVRDAYLLTVIRTFLSNGGRSNKKPERGGGTEEESLNDEPKARSAIIFVSTCERAALVSEILGQVGVKNVALHSLLSQNRRLAALAKFKSQIVQVLVATDVASRGLDIPTVDLVINAELPRNPVSYVHRVGRTARAGRRGRAVSLVSENDVALVHAAEKTTGRSLEKCSEVTDEAAIRMLGAVTKASRLAKMKLSDIGFDELVKKSKERKVRDRKERRRIEKALQKKKS